MKPAVRDIYLAALASTDALLQPLELAAHLVELGQASGFERIHERRSPDLIELTFEATGEIIRFDGAAWHYVAPAQV